MNFKTNSGKTPIQQNFTVVDKTIDQIFSLIISPKAGPQHNDTSFGSNATGGITLNSSNSFWRS